MSRSGYRESDDFDEPLELCRWRGAVQTAIRGKRGQAFLREALAALDAMPEQRLIADSFARPDTAEVCTLGAVARSRGVDVMLEIGMEPDEDPEDLDRESVAAVFGIPHSLACEIMYENDEGGRHNQTPEERWVRMRRWIDRQLIEWEADHGC